MPHLLGAHSSKTGRRANAAAQPPTECSAVAAIPVRCEAPAERSVNTASRAANHGLAYLQTAARARARQNVFTALMQAVKTHSLGQISHALYEVGGEYRRNM